MEIVIIESRLVLSVTSSSKNGMFVITQTGVKCTMPGTVCQFCNESFKNSASTKPQQEASSNTESSDFDDDKAFCATLVPMFKKLPPTLKLDARIESLRLLQRYQKQTLNQSSSLSSPDSPPQKV